MDAAPTSLAPLLAVTLAVYLIAIFWLSFAVRGRVTDNEDFPGRRAPAAAVARLGDAARHLVRRRHRAHRGRRGAGLLELIFGLDPAAGILISAGVAMGYTLLGGM